MTTPRIIGLLAAGIILSTAAAQAGTLTNGVWTPSSCGAEPVAPTMDMSSEKAFNASLNTEEDYEKKNSDYVNCVIKEATTDQNAVASAANAIRQKRQTETDKVKADVDTGITKFSKKK
jgi:hypothetical protein